MKKIKLGLDVGTNSIGWAVMEKQDKLYNFFVFEDENGNLIPSKGSYIFSKGSQPNESSKAAERRGFRGARRRIDRIRLRKIATLKVLEKFGLCPTFDPGELNRWKNKKIYPSQNNDFIEWQRTGKKNGNSKSERLKQPYYLRHLAATNDGMMNSNTGKLQLGRAFYHLAQRRGYLSNAEEEQTEDNLEIFKNQIRNLVETTEDVVSFIEPFKVSLDLFKSDKKVKVLGNRILKETKKEVAFENIKIFIQKEFDKPENLGKVMQGIGELSEEMKDHPTMGSYFYSIYSNKNKETGLVYRIRGRYTHREEHYLAEFNYICDKQNIKEELRDKLQNAIFYQRPLKSQKGLVANCTLEPKRKRIALSHPLFEEFRMWESINRIKIRREGESKLDFLTKDEKLRIKEDFMQISDFEFSKLAKKLSDGKIFRYSKDKKVLEAEVEFNFPMDKKFSACPTTAALHKIIGVETYARIPLLNTGYHDEKSKKQVSIEDVWHCLQMDSYGSKDKKTVRREFAENHLQLDEKGIENFVKVKLVKGYGSLSKAAIKKILPFLENGEIYTNAVFLANVTEVLGRKLSEQELKKVTDTVSEALRFFQEEKRNKGIVNNYIFKFKDKGYSLGEDTFSVESHKSGLHNEMVDWIGELQLNKFNTEEIDSITNKCWQLFYEAVEDKSNKEISFLSSTTIPHFIEDGLRREFPNDAIDVSKLYHPSALEAYPKADKKLGNPEISSIKNPVFNRTMHQVKRLCNELIRKGLVDKDTVVNLEVAGEINSASYRRALAQWQKEQETIRDWAKQKIINLNPEDKRENIIPTPAEIAKYILWQEQNRKCLYTSGKEICVTDFLGGKTIYDIEHTIPRSKFHDNSLKNKTLANSDFNRNYKQDTLPALLNINFEGVLVTRESLLLNRDKYLKSYTIKSNEITWDVSLDTLKYDYKKFRRAAKSMTDAASHEEIMTKAHYTKLKLDYLRDKYRNFEIEEINHRFTNANLVDTRIIAKYTRAYLNSYFNRVNVVNGKITDTLRKMWGLQREDEEKDRSNHIHHCIDATVVACVEKGTVNWISEAYHKYENDYFRGNDNPKIRLKEPMEDFASRMHNLYKEVFIYHRQTDRIKPLLENTKKKNAKKLNLRGKLNSQNPYAHIKVNDELVFAQRKPVSKLRDKDIDNIIDDGIKKRITELVELVGMKFFIKESTSKGFIVLPKYFDEEKDKLISEMIIKKIRLKSSKTNLKDYKVVRELDRKPNFEHKHDFYFDKDAYTNYEARIYGGLIPDQPDKKIKFSNRRSILINNYNVVKNIFEEEMERPILKIHQGDMFLFFDKNPNNEINWESVFDLQTRLFKVTKMTENKDKGGIKQIIFQRHNYALGNVDDAISTSEDDLSNPEGVVLRKSISALGIVPVKMDSLGRLDIEFSKSFLQEGRD
ncbi:hypothetical protein O4H26_00180 [Aequorivita viscosa]|nr:hypothetical protein [Aequorivita viscosa]